jgi:hypothetical protein
MQYLIKFQTIEIIFSVRKIEKVKRGEDTNIKSTTKETSERNSRFLTQ